jgi:hypothetical protein
MMTLVPGREYPKYVYHATKPPVMVHSAQERAKLGSEWSDTYIHQPYPKLKYHWTGETIKVQNADEEAALEKGWADTPAAFEPYKGSRQPKTQDQDPVKWVDAWAVVDLSSEHRNRIKAQLLRADAAYWRSPDAASADTDAMRQAFTGVAKVLAEAGILTEELLKNEMPTLVWDSAIAGGWYRFASETPQDIFPEQIGHHWVWRDRERDWKNLFYSENREWLAWLLENPPKNAGDPSEPVRRTLAESVPGQMDLPPRAHGKPAADGGADSATASGDGPSLDFTSAAGRSEAIAAYTQHWTCSGAALARTARVDRADLSKWKKGLLPAESDKNRRIEAALKNNQQPTPAVKKSTDF